MTEVVAALIWDDDRFMICQRPVTKSCALLWEFVGGKVEKGETKEQALIRECREELGIGLSVGDVFTEVIHQYPDITVHLTLFNAAISEGIPQKLEHNVFRITSFYVLSKSTQNSPFLIYLPVLLRHLSYFLFLSTFSMSSD